MKKILALMIIVLVVFTLGGCRKSETSKSTVKENTELDNDLNNLDKTDQELNTSGLDNLDQDLNKVNW